MRHHDERAEAVVLDEIDLAREAVDLRMVPGDRKHDRRIEEHAEVVGIVRALDEIPEVSHDPAAKCLLDAELALIAFARLRESGRRRTAPFNPRPLDSNRFSLYGVSSVRP